MKRLVFAVLLSMALFPVFSTQANATNTVVKEASVWVTLEEIINAQPDISVTIIGTSKYDLASTYYEVRNYQDLYNEYGPNWRNHVHPNGPLYDEPFSPLIIGDVQWGANSIITTYF